MSPDSSTDPGQSSTYPEEFLSTFLSSIKVFGYLEKPVFNELARNLVEKKLEPNEILFGPKTTDRSFYVVVEGCVKVSIISASDQSSSGTILSEVKAGGIVSSLFNVVSVLSDGTDSKPSPTEAESGDNVNVDSDSKSNFLFAKLNNASKSFSGYRRNVFNAHKNLTAQASSKTILIFLPESVFFNLAVQFPVAASHIVQVILTRFQRVTLKVLHKYLGLNNELLQIEKSVNQICSDGLPSNLKRLLNQFDFPVVDVNTSSASIKQDTDNEIKRWKTMRRNRTLTDSVFGLGLEALTSASATQVDFRKAVAQELLRHLGIDQQSFSVNFEQFLLYVSNFIRFVRIPESTLLTEENDYAIGLFYLLEGKLSAFKQSTDNVAMNICKNDHILFDIKPGSLIGYMSAFLRQPSFVSIKACSDVFVAVIERHNITRLVDKEPQLLFKLFSRLSSKLSDLIFNLDFALEWTHLNAGQALFHKNDISETIYIVLNGRMRGIVEKENKEKLNFNISNDVLVSEFGPGDSFGELEVFTDMKRQCHFHAIRESELIGLPKSLLYALSHVHPHLTFEMAKLIILKSQKKKEVPRTNLRTIAIVPLDQSVPVHDFADSLYQELSIINSTTLLDASTIAKSLGKHVLTPMGRLKLLSWLSELEEKYKICLYLADYTKSSWTQRCVKQADCILMVALAYANPSITELESYLLGVKSTARKELVLLHPERGSVPGATLKWLSKRPWILDHHHLQMHLKPNVANLYVHNDEKADDTISHIANRIKGYYLRFYNHDNSIKTASGNSRGDFSRLARRLSGNSIGLVLGGGGARGLAHIGIIQALEEAGVNIDLIGGTSIGSLIGALYARDLDSFAIFGLAKSFSGRMTSVWRQLLDFTYPVTSWFTGHAFNRTLWKCFGVTQIEDLWLNYFAVTTNITHSRMEVHRSGFVWRFVRASMSLSGFLPPLCDQGYMLLDGGYVNNLPADVMSEVGAKIVIAVDVGSEEDTTAVDYGDTVSGWWILLMRILGRKVAVPTLADIQSRLAYVSCVQKLEETKLMPNTIYLRPPVQNYATMEFGKFNEIVACGYAYAKQLIEEWDRNGILSKLKQVKETKFGRLRRNSI